MRESAFSKKVCKLLRGMGAYVVRTQAGSIHGIPDLLISYRGKFVAWELKTNIGSATKLQLRELELLTKSGALARVVRPSNLELELALLEEFTK